MKEKHWVKREYDETEAQRLSKKVVSSLLASMLCSRGVNVESVGEFLDPSLKNLKEPFLFADMEKGVNRLTDAIMDGEMIGIFGDYDVDGVCSTAVLEQFLRSVSSSVCTTLPNRMSEGYGLSSKGIDRLKAQGAKVLVTVDCGISAHEQVDYANSLGLEVIIIDHHTVGESLPNARAVINPKRSDCSSDASYLCAAGVVFFLCMALRRSLRESGWFLERSEPDIRELLDLVALATVCDVVPLISDNRILVKAGLKVLKQGSRIGLLALMKTCGVEKEKVSSTNLGFHLGPRINAAGRLEDAALALTLMNEKDESRAENIAHELNQQNLARKNIEEETVKEACSLIEKKELLDALVLHDESWHVGVVGIVASRIAERYHRPAIIIGEKGKGSGRSIKGIDLHAMVQKASKSLIGFGGHAHAIGLTLGEQGVDAFRSDLLSVMAQVSPSVFGQSIYYDAEVNIADLSLDLVEELSLLEPYGAKNPYPVIRIDQVFMRNLKRLNGGHIKGELESPKGVLSFIGFRMDIDDRLASMALDALGILEKNEWNGRVSLQLRLVDFRESLV